MNKIVYLLLCLGISIQVSAQSLVDDANLSIPAVEGGNTFTETIKIISASKKIFILTNNNQQLGPGDFISLALANNLAARAVVAKLHQGQVGIKILKIYSVAQWSRLRRDQEVQVIKGDDSLFGKKAEAKVDESATSKIKSEEDLYTGDVVAESEFDGLVEENKNRHIKPDNVIAVSGAYLDANEIRSRGGKVRTPMFGFSWAYQFTDNYFVEGVYGRALIDNYPDESLQTLVNQIVVRLKYNIKGPLYTFFMPYVGFRTHTVSSPDAGKVSGPQGDQENEVIDELKKSGPVAGVTVLRRLVPGWFIKADIGSDILNVGFAIEF